MAHDLARTNPVVLMFRANWNQPSKAMMKPFRDMALAKKNQAIFCQLDVDTCKVCWRPLVNSMMDHFGRYGPDG